MRGGAGARRARARVAAAAAASATASPPAVIRLFPAPASFFMRKLPTMTVAFSAALAIVLPQRCLSAKAFAHGWSTVSDVIAMHGKYRHLDEHPPRKDIEFIARNYPSMVTTGCGCGVGRGEPSAQGLTIEESVLATAARIKEVNSEVKVGMYWRTDTALELAECSGFAREWAAHPEYYLKNDTGGVIGPHHYYDYLNPAAAGFFQKVLFNVTMATLPSGKPILDFLYLDGGGTVSKGAHVPGIKGSRSQQLIEGRHRMISALQRQLDAQSHGQILVLNAMDEVESAQEYVATGAAGAMFDHWSILGFLNHSDGSFNKTKMDEGFRLVTSSLLANVRGSILILPVVVLLCSHIAPLFCRCADHDPDQRLARADHQAGSQIPR